MHVHTLLAHFTAIIQCMYMHDNKYCIPLYIVLSNNFFCV